MPSLKFLPIFLALMLPLGGAVQNSSGARNQRARAETDLPRGAWAHGAINDYVLRSPSVHAVIGGFPQDSDADTVAPFRFGALLDIVPSLRHGDGFGYLMPGVTHPGGEVAFQDPAIEFASGTDGNASIRVRRLQTEGRRAFTTHYWLGGDAPGLLIDSRLVDAPDDWVVEDRIAWGEFEVFVAGIGFGMPDGVVVQGVEFLMGERDGDAIILIPESGTLSVRREGALTTIAYEGYQGEDSTRRWLLVGDDAAGLFSWFMQSRRGDEVAHLTGRVMEHESDAASGAAWTRGARHAEMLLALPSEDGTARSYLPFVTREDGSFDLAVPAGEYLIVPDQRRSSSRPASLRVAVEAGSRAEDLDFAVAAFPSVTIVTVDDATGEPLAARLQFRRVDGGDMALYSHGDSPHSRDQLLTTDGRERVSLPPGEYEIRASSGIEFHPATARITSQEGSPVSVQLRLKRAFDTPGWLAGDLASRTNMDPHSSAAVSDRIDSARAESLEWIAPGNTQALWTTAEPPIQTSWLDRDDLSVLRIGQEVEGELACGIWMPSEAEWREVTALKIEEQRAMLEEANVVGLAVWDASVPDAFGTRFQHLQTLRDAGLNLLPFGASNAFEAMGEEVGYPRVHAEADEPDNVSDALFAGRYQVTNGPFVDARVNGEKVSGTIETSDGALDFDLRIHAIDEVSVARVTVLVNGRLTRQLLFNESLRESGSGVAVPMPTDSEAGKFRLQVTRDSVIDLVVEGDEARPNPLVSPRGSPFAKTNADRGTLSRAFLAPIHVRFTEAGEASP